MLYLNNKEERVRYIKGPIYFGEISKWVRCVGVEGYSVLSILKHRYAVDRSKKKEWVTIPRETAKVFGLGYKVLRRVRRQLSEARLIEVRRNAGRPYQYRIIGK